MKQSNYRILLTDFEKRIILNALVAARNNQIKNGKEYDCLDELIIKICESKEKRFIGKSNETR